MLNVRMNKAKSMFFDRQLNDKVDAGIKRVLSGFGARTRTVAQRSIRYATRTRQVSQPGKPPIAHRSGFGKPSKQAGAKRRAVSLLREYIFFVYEPERRGVIIGPVKLNGTTGDAPHALEHGGHSAMTRWITQGGRRRKTTRKKTSKVFIKPRPFMAPAGRQVLSNLPEHWRNSIR